jgi:hypothetical protein
VPHHLAVGRELGREVVDIWLHHSRLRSEHPDPPVRDSSAAGLIAGTVPTTGRSSAVRTVSSAMVDAVLQAITISCGS